METAHGPEGLSMSFYHTSGIFERKTSRILSNTFTPTMYLRKASMPPRHLHCSYSYEIGSSELNDFRPISLIGEAYIINAKLLAKRLEKVVHKLINK